MMSVDKGYSIGAVISWKDGPTSNSGEIEEIHETDFEIELNGVREAISATSENPAYVIALPDETKVVQRHRDVTRLPI